MSPIHPNASFEVRYFNIKNNSAVHPNHLQVRGGGVSKIINDNSVAVALLVDEKQEKVEFTLSHANPELVKELLLFMMSKKWLSPSTDIYSFLKKGDKKSNGKKEIIDEWPNVENKESFNEHKSILDAEDEFLITVNATIEDHLDDENFRPKVLARKAFLCEMQLCRKLKKLANLSTANYIRKYRLLRSLSFLKKAHLSISEVCYKVGFRSLEYFSRSFKKEFGVCPSTFRKRFI